MKLTTRDSNMELLRIIAMLFVVMQHYHIHCICPDLIQMDVETSLTVVCSSLIHGFLYVGVVLFLLISGFYGIKLKARTVWKFYLQLAFYGLFGYLFYHFTTDEPLTHVFISKTIFALSHPMWWFVAYYLILMLISPLFNKGIEMMTKKQYLWALISFAFLEFYLGFFWQKKAYDPDGYNVLNFMFIYAIGGFIRRFVSIPSTVRARTISLSVYVLCALLWGVCSVLRICFQLPFGAVFAYNNPLIIIGAVSLFLFFTTLHFQNKVINWFAGGVFAAYLIQDQPYFGNPLYNYMAMYFDSYGSYGMQILLLMVISVLFVTLCVAVDKMRSLITRPLLSMMDRIDRLFEENRREI